MSVSSMLWLLAACSTSVIAGPVPPNIRRQLFTNYENTSSISSSASKVIQVSSSPADLSSALLPSESSIAPPTLVSMALSSPAPSSTSQLANAETAIIVQPIQVTVITHVIPGITFVNPSGHPVITEGPETILSTSYIIPTPAPTTQESSSSSSSTIPSPSTTPSQIATPTGSSTTLLSSNSVSAVSSAAAVVGNGTVSETSQSAPMFTYSPTEKETGTQLASATVSATGGNPTPSSGGLPGSNYLGSTFSSAQIVSTSAAPATISSSVISTSAGQVPSSATVKSSGQLVPHPSSASDSLVASSTTPAVVMKTEYTTVYPSATPADTAPVLSQVSPLLSQVSPLGSPAPTEPQQTLSVQQTSSEAAAMPTASASLQVSAAGSFSSAATALPTTPLEPPPVVIITQYTTVTPSSDAEPTGAPETMSTPVVSNAESSALVSSLYVNPSASSVAQPTATAPAVSSSAEPIQASQAPQITSSAPPSSAAASSSTTEAAQPSPASTQPSPSPAPASSTSEDPLIITPIPPSQIFTVTVTTTEKETITDTATVTVTARA